MDVTLGPFKSASSISSDQSDTLAKAMSDQALATAAATAGISGIAFDPKKPAPKGFAISGQVTDVTTDAATRKTHVIANFLVLIDNTLSNTIVPRAAAYGEGTPAAGILKDITDDAIGKLLKAIKSGQVKKQG